MAGNISYTFERYEKKYFITPKQQQLLLAALCSRIRPDTYGAYTICNLYYDTDDWRLIRASIEKPVYKEKLRVRSYGVPQKDDKVFIELKKKFDGVVYKRRITAQADQSEMLLNGTELHQNHGQIGREIDWFQQFYHTKPKVFIAYDRTAYAGIELPELRITFDSNLRWRDTELELSAGDYGARLLPDRRILMEVKLPGVCPLWLSHLLSEMKIFPVTFSKYGYCYQQYLLPNSANTNSKEDHRCA